MLLIRRSGRTLLSQPQGLAEVDWGNPLTRGLEWLKTSCAGGMPAVGRADVSTGAQIIAPTSIGLANGYTGTGTNYSDIPAGYGNAAEGSLLIVHRSTVLPPSGPTYCHVLAASDGSDTDNGWQLMLGNGSGLLQWDAYGSSSGSGVRAEGATPLNDGKWHATVATWSTAAGGTHATYVDGQSHATTTTGAAYTVSSPVRIASHRSTFWGQFEGQIAAFGLWRRPLSPAEARQLTQSVALTWQLFRAPARRVWAPLITTAVGVIGNAGVSTSAGAITGVQVHAGVAAATTVSTSSTAPAGKQVHIGAAATAAVFGGLTAPFGQQVHMGAVSGAVVPTKSFRVGGYALGNGYNVGPYNGEATAVLSQAAVVTASAGSAGVQSHVGVVATAAVSTASTAPTGSQVQFGTAAAVVVANTAAAVAGKQTHLGVVAPVAVATTATGNFATQVHQAVVVSASIAATAGTPAGAMAGMPAVAPANIATTSSAAAGTQVQQGVMAAANVATSAGSIAGTKTSSGGVAAAALATSSSTVAGTQVHQGLVASAAVAIATESVAGSTAGGGAVAGAAVATSSSTITGIQTHLGLVASAAVATAATGVAGLLSPNGGIVATASITFGSASVTGATQIQRGGVANASIAITSAGAAGYLGGQLLLRGLRSVRAVLRPRVVRAVIDNQGDPMGTLVTLPPFDVDESDVVPFLFEDALPDGVTLTDATLSVDRRAGSEATPASFLVGQHQLQGRDVLQQLDGRRVSPGNYAVRCVANRSDGLRSVAVALITVSRL